MSDSGSAPDPDPSVPLMEVDMRLTEGVLVAVTQMEGVIGTEQGLDLFDMPAQVHDIPELAGHRGLGHEGNQGQGEPRTLQRDETVPL